MKLRQIWHRVLEPLKLWFDADNAAQVDNPRAVDWVRTVPFIAMHIACIAVIWVGWSPVAVLAALGLYLFRMFAITAFYHRYFSHRSFKTSRWLQFLFAVAGASAVQRGPLWWAAHHRVHHASADTEHDPHSPVVDHFWWSHMSWFLCREHFATRMDRIKDFARFPELRFIDRYDMLVPVVFAVALYGIGLWLESALPNLGTTAWQFFVWTFVISTVLGYHATFTVNSLAHRWGKKVLPTKDDSRNNWFIALITLGEGWHNNHHYYPASTRQGLLWWEIDLTWYVLWAMEKLGLIWNVRTPPARVFSDRKNARRLTPPSKENVN